MKNILTALIRVVRIVVAAALPVAISYLAGQGNPKLAALGPIINGIAKYLRDQLGWNWLPV